MQLRVPMFSYPTSCRQLQHGVQPDCSHATLPSEIPVPLSLGQRVMARLFTTTTTTADVGRSADVQTPSVEPSSKQSTTSNGTEEEASKGVQGVGRGGGGGMDTGGGGLGRVVQGGDDGAGGVGGVVQGGDDGAGGRVQGAAGGDATMPTSTSASRRRGGGGGGDGGGVMIGVYPGFVLAVVAVKHAYVIEFDDPKLGRQEVDDSDVMSIEPLETVALHRLQKTRVIMPSVGVDHVTFSATKMSAKTTVLSAIKGTPVL